jgi:AcrR family transcriptional regulator
MRTDRPGLRRQILDAAASVTAARGPAASMAEIAFAAGIGRATLYRYFPTREALVSGLVRDAVDELTAAVEAAELDTVDLREGVARLGRAFLGTATRYASLMHLGIDGRDKPADLEDKLLGPVRDLLRRGVESGELRDDVPPELHVELLTGLLEKALGLVLAGRLPTERASAVISSVFFDGAAAADRTEVSPGRSPRSRSRSRARRATRRKN